MLLFNIRIECIFYYFLVFKSIRKPYKFNKNKTSRYYVFTTVFHQGSQRRNLGALWMWFPFIYFSQNS